MYLAVFLSLLAAPAAERSPAQEGKVLILASSDVVVNEFLAHGAEYADNARFVIQAVEAFCLDQRILLAGRVPAEAGRKISPALEEILRQHPDTIAVTYYASSTPPASHRSLQ